MEDPEPLERVARGVPAAFAAIVRKLMAKNPDDRYQTCAELRHDLARWVDPEKVRAILGTEADSARAFRPPVPEIEDDDLRILTDAGATSSGVSLRDLGDAEPAAAPFTRPTPPPMAAVVVPLGRKWHRDADADEPEDDDDDDEDDVPAATSDDTRWLIQVIAVAVVLLLLAILAITLFV